MSRSQRGFTLIELMVVIAVIAILSAIAIPQYQSYNRRMKCLDGKATLLKAAAVVERYRAQHGSYKGLEENFDKIAQTQSPASGKAVFKVRFKLGWSVVGYTSCHIYKEADAKEHYCLTLEPLTGSGMEYGKADAMMILGAQGQKAAKSKEKYKIIWDNDCRGI